MNNKGPVAGFFWVSRHFLVVCHISVIKLLENERKFKMIAGLGNQVKRLLWQRKSY